jgi:hypothetical protein
MADEFVTLSFTGLSAAQASQEAKELRATILREAACDPDLVRIDKASNETQEGGALVVVILSAPAVVALANQLPKAIASAVKAWSTRNSRGRIVIKTKDREVVVEGDALDHLDDVLPLLPTAPRRR